MKKLILLVLIIGAGVAVFVAKPDEQPPVQLQANQVAIGEQILTLEVADSIDERVTGLSGRDSLAQDKALLFVFDNVDEHGIWMKDMKFPIDIIWLDENKKVVGIKTDVSPDTYPESFEPGSPAKYVIETNAGVVNAGNLSNGDSLEF